MWQTREWHLVGLVVVLMLLLSLGGCTDGEATNIAGDGDQPVRAADDSAEAAGETGGHDEEEEMAGEHAEEGHAIPEEAAELENPVEVTDSSTEVGAALFSANCAICHGVEGRGDGPSAETLDPPPADLHADHVQVLTDGELFWVITHGVEDTGMPPWEDVLTDEERWQVVNFIRSVAE